MSCQRCGADSKRIKYADGRCVSEAGCTKRLRERGADGTVRVRVVLENPPARSTVDQAARLEKEIRNVRYCYGLCVDCGLRGHSAGRTRCEACHRAQKNTPGPKTEGVFVVRL